MKQWIERKPLQLFTAVILTLFVIGLSVTFTLSFRTLYYSDIERLNIVEETGYSEATIRENYDVLIDYSMALTKKTLDFPSFPMSERGRGHFEDAKVIFNAFEWMAILLSVVSAALIWWSVRRKCFRFLKYASFCMSVLPVTLAVLAGIFWDKVFVIFHKIFFRNDDWLFDPDFDPIITILPDQFFLHCAFLIFALVFFFAAVCFLLYRIFRKKKDKGITFSLTE